MSAPAGRDEGGGQARSPAVRTYRALMRVLPRAVREADGEEMARTFAAMWARRGPRGRAVLAAASVAGLIAVAAAEWIDVAATTFRCIRGSSLDFRLGFRMLVKYPGLTLVGGLAMAFAIWTGATGFELVTQLYYPRLPVPGGDRIVAIRQVDTTTGDTELRTTHDFVQWREQLTSVEELGAYRTLPRNLAIEGRGVAPIEIAEISASAFRLIPQAPLLGRTLLSSDEAPGAPAVVVIGHGVWQQRFGGDPDVIGRSVHVGATQATVVGVMPEGFVFPIAHSVWLPLQLDSHERPREGPAIRIFGRLADGATMADAQTELSGLGARMAADRPDTHTHLRPRILRYANSAFDFSEWRSREMLAVNLLLVMLLVLICGNVGLLMFARAASRESEMVVRNALGASRGRIVLQLFVEALVLGGVAAVVGLVATGIGLRWGIGVLQFALPAAQPLPFWIRDTLSPMTILYAALLTVIGAAIAGILPALRVTRGLQSHLRASGAGGGGLRIGGIWSIVMIVQIAITVALPVPAFFIQRDADALAWSDPHVNTAEYIVAVMALEADPARGGDRDSAAAAFRARVGRTYGELQRRLAIEPGVAGVTFGDRLPRMGYPHRPVEVDEGGAEPRDPSWTWPGYRVAVSRVAVDFLDTFGAPVLNGRGFSPADSDTAQRVIIVNESFVEQVLGTRNPIGRRVRYVNAGDDSEPLWYEIVGVVRDFGVARGPPGHARFDGPAGERGAAIYHAAGPGDFYPLHVAVRVHGEVRDFMPRLREVGVAVDPTLRLNARPMDTVRDADIRAIGLAVRLILTTCAVALLLSLAGIYAVMSFTVARRTREIGIRVALGANARGIVIGIFRRPLTQVGLGIAAGAVLVLWLMGGTERLLPPGDLARLGLYVLFMTAVCLLACVVPTRRALSIEPTEALKADA